MPLPSGYTLDDEKPKLPAGYTLDAGSDFVARNRKTGGLPGEMIGPQAEDQNPIVGALVGAGKNIIGVGNNVAKMVGMTPNPDLEAALEPENTSQAVGDFIATIAPYGAVAKPLKAAEGAVAASQAVQSLPRLAQTAVNAVTRAGVQGAATGAISAAQGGDFSDAAVMGAVGGAAEPAIAAALTGTAKAMGNRLVGATKGAMKTGAQPGQAVIESGPMIGTKGTLLNKLQQAKKAAGDELGRILNPSTAQIDVTNSIIDPAMRHERILSARGDSADVVREVMDGVVADFQRMGANPGNATPAQIHNVIVNLSEGLNFLRDAAAGTKNAIIKDIRKALSDQVKAAVPESVDAFSRYANLAAASGALRDKIAADATSSGVGRVVKDVLIKGAAATIGKAAGISNPVVAAGVLGSEALATTPGQLALIRMLSRSATPKSQGLIRGMIANAMSGDDDEFGTNAATTEALSAAAEASNGDPASARQILHSKRAVYVQPDNTEIPIPEGLTRSLFNGIQ